MKRLLRFSDSSIQNNKMNPRRALSRAPRLKRQVTICEDSISIPDSPRVRNRSSSPKSPRQPSIKQSHASLNSSGVPVVTVVGQAGSKAHSPCRPNSSPQIFRYEEDVTARTLPVPPSPESAHSSVPTSGASDEVQRQKTKREQNN